MEGYVDSYLATTRSPGAPRPSLEGDEETDVCVVGGGLAGLSVAIELAERGVQVSVIEGRRIGWGASGRNMGMVGLGFSLGARKIIAKVGMDDARELFALSRKGAETVRRRVSEYEIDCEPMADGVLNVALFDESDRMKRSSAFMTDNFGHTFDLWSKERLREAVVTDRYQAGMMVEGRFMLHPQISVWASPPLRRGWEQGSTRVALRSLSGVAMEST